MLIRNEDDEAGVGAFPSLRRRISGVSELESVHVDRAGDGQDMVLLLHGLNGDAAVWDRTIPLLLSSGYAVLAPDLPGHGRSGRLERYHAGQLAAAVANALPAGARLHIFAHSLGGVIGALLAGGAFGMNARTLFAFGVKLEWSEDERAAMGRIPTVRRFDQRAEAEARLLKVNGLSEAPSARFVDIGVVADGEGFRLAADPRVATVVGVEAKPLFVAAKGAGTRLMLASGARDSLAPLKPARDIIQDAREIPGVGHNPHVQAPDLLVELWRDWLKAV